MDTESIILLGAVVAVSTYIVGYMLGWGAGYSRHRRLEDGAVFIPWKDEDGTKGYVKFYPRRIVWGQD